MTFATTSRLPDDILDAQLDIKRLVESHDDAGYDPYTPLELLAEAVQATFDRPQRHRQPKPRRRITRVAPWLGRGGD